MTNKEELQQLYNQLIDKGLLKKEDYINNTLSIYENKLLRDFKFLINNLDGAEESTRLKIEEAEAYLYHARDILDSIIE